MKFLSVTAGLQEIYLQYDEGMLYFCPISEKIMRCVYTKKNFVGSPSILFEEAEKKEVFTELSECEEKIQISTKQVCVEVNKADGVLTWKKNGEDAIYLQEGKKELHETEILRCVVDKEEAEICRVRTVDGERNFIGNLKEEIIKTAYQGRLNFCFQEEEGIYGLGQGEEGIYNYRGQTKYLYQHNMRIPMPVFLSSRKYGIAMDCSSLMIFHEDENEAYFYLDAVEQMDYYFVAGENFDEIIAGIRSLSGRSAMLPKWAFGYIQSKEKYTSARELVEIAEEYRRREIPLDCVVQDWESWENGMWGNKHLDPARYGDLKECVKRLQELNVHSMISIWPNMSSNCRDYKEHLEKGYLLGDFSTYDAFNRDARNLYWKQAKEGLFDQGFDAWWCDSSEPFSGPDWYGEVLRVPEERYRLVGGEHKKFLGAENANLYSLWHAKGIYENQRETNNQKRVLNLTRSGYVSGSKYGSVLWSGDISAKWDTLKKQITEGLNMSLSGYPYWTLDIGGFFVVKENWKGRGCGCHNDPTPKWFWNGDFEEGIKDKGYCELYTRWLQFGCFLPMFRSHGTDTPREIWNFGEKGTMFYDAIEKFIHLRYSLMPYIYSLAGAVWKNHASMMRSLLFDFIDDKKAHAISDQYMFGPSLLICPVTKPMYYEKENREIDQKREWTCYLPAGTGWYDFWTEQYYEGGQEVTVHAPIDVMPMFVREGAILPLAHGLQYANDRPDVPLEIRVYSGADGTFDLYEDEGDGYGYESGNYKITRLRWDDKEQRLWIAGTEGSYHGILGEYRLGIIKKNRR